jgi:hypothetical protein
LCPIRNTSFHNLVVPALSRDPDRVIQRLGTLFDDLSWSAKTVVMDPGVRRGDAEGTGEGERATGGSSDAQGCSASGCRHGSTN